MASLRERIGKLVNVKGLKEVGKALKTRKKRKKALKEAKTVEERAEAQTRKF